MFPLRVTGPGPVTHEIPVRDWLGHDSIKTTERYAHLAPGGLHDAVRGAYDVGGHRGDAGGHRVDTGSVNCAYRGSPR